MHKQGKEVEAVAISPDGSLLVSGGRDGLLVLMTLMVPSIVPRSDAHHMHLTSSILRKSQVVRDRSYIHDVTADDDITLELEEDEDLMASLMAEEEEMTDHFPLEPKKTEKKSFSRMKRRSRFDEKETELHDYATVRKKTGVSAKTARGKRTKGKSYDIPTMVAHLSAAVRVYGPEEPNSSSDSEGETSPRAPQPEPTAPREDPKVDILSHIKAWSNPQNISTTVPKTKPKDLPEGLGKAKTHKHFFESGDPVVSKHHVEGRDEEEKENLSEGFLQKYGKLLPAELENTLQNSYSPSTTDQPLEPTQYDVGNSYRLEDLMAVNSEDSLLQWTHSPIPIATEESGGKTGGEQFIPTLPAQQEEDGEYSEDDVPMSMI